MLAFLNDFIWINSLGNMQIKTYLSSDVIYTNTEFKYLKIY
jgi:hypothetical protein